ncbi:hypothetical protein KJ359_003371 [Pestalotiopsis sp. 9143b]|nr:hypothetical protein KJ359_003371 [Pestalotiopsis sp. 9143b]
MQVISGVWKTGDVRDGESENLVDTSKVFSAPLKRDTAERYIFANCVDNSTSAAYAAIFWYYPDFLPDFPEPQATAYVSNGSAVEYAGATTAVTTPFTLKAAIPANATSAAEGDVVSTDASAGSFAGPMAVVKGSGAVFYSPEDGVNCYEEYWQRDVSLEDLERGLLSTCTNCSQNQPVQDP